MAQQISDEQWRELLETRATRPAAVAEAYASRKRPEGLLSERGTIFLVAADHPARGSLASGPDAMAMADRRGLLERLMTALSRPGVDGALGSPDIVEELLLLGALEGKVVVGSMNRGGLDGAAWTMDDRFTGYDAASIKACRLEGGKMLLRIDDEDAGTAPTLHACARAVSELAEHRLMAMVEPLPYHRDSSGRLALRKDTASLARAVTVASALGTTSAWTWLKMPSCDEPEVVYGATTLPCVVLGGAPGPDPEADLAVLGQDAASGRRARPGRRTLAALPARRRRRPGRRRGGRHPGRHGRRRDGRSAMTVTERVAVTPTSGTVRLTTAAGPGALDGGTALRAARRHRSALVRRRVRDLRARQRARPRHRPVRRSGGAADLARPERAGHGARGDRLRAGHGPASGHGGDVVGRSRGAQHGHGGGAGPRQPAARAAPARRHVHRTRARPGAAAGRALRRPHHQRQRRVPGGLPLLRPDHPARSSSSPRCPRWRGC